MFMRPGPRPLRIIVPKKLKTQFHIKYIYIYIFLISNIYIYIFFFFRKSFRLRGKKSELDTPSMIDHNMAQKDAVCVPGNAEKRTNIQPWYFVLIWNNLPTWCNWVFVFFQLEMFRAYTPIFRSNWCYNFFTYAARHQHTHSSGPTPNYTKDTISCICKETVTSIAPEDGRISPKYVELKEHK